MSGGSYDYAYQRVEAMADEMAGRYCMAATPQTGPDPRRVAFVRHLRLVAQAMRAIEWVDSCDAGAGEEAKSIDAVFADAGPPTRVLTPKDVKGLLDAADALRELAAADRAARDARAKLASLGAADVGPECIAVVEDARCAHRGIL